MSKKITDNNKAVYPGEKPAPDRDTVKNDLRKLRFLSRAIEASMQAEQRHRERARYLREHGGAPAEIERLEGVLQALNTAELIKKATAFEAIYMGAIQKLDAVDQTIVLDGIVNGKPYWKIGNEAGYAAETVRYHAARAMERIEELVRAEAAGAKKA